MAVPYKNRLHIMRILLIILICLMANIAVADEFRIPISCYPIDLQRKFEERGRKLDLITDRRTPESWGYLLNRGSAFTIFTYRSATKEDLELILEIIRNG
jgi:hypothetical protein